MRAPLFVGQAVVGLVQASTASGLVLPWLQQLIQGTAALISAEIEGAAGRPGPASALAGQPSLGYSGDAALALLASLGELLESPTELNLEQALVRAIGTAVPALADYGVLSLAENGQSRVVAVARAPGRNGAEAATSPDVVPDPIPTAWIDQAIHTGQSVLIRELAGNRLVHAAQDAHHLVRLLTAQADSWIVVPLVVQDQTIGAISFLSKAASGRAFGFRELTVAEAFVRRAAALALSARRLDEFRGALLERDHFLLASAHDIRNVLAVMRMRTQALQSRASELGGLGDELAAGLARLQATTTRIAGLAADLVDLASRKAGQPPRLERRNVDLAALVADALVEHQPIAVRHELVHTTSGRVSGQWDAGRLRRVVDNLLQNAIRYSPAGGKIELHVRRERNAAGLWAVLTIRDHGIGIPAEDLPHVFTAFRRGANVQAWTGGTGIGLAAVKQTVEEHGGTVQVESTPGEGSTFTVRLPIAGRRRSAGRDTPTRASA